MKASVILTLFTILLITISGCRKAGLILGGHDSSSSGSRVIALNGQKNLTIENTNGKIDISASDTAKSIYCNIEKEVKSGASKEDAKSHLSAININVIRSSADVIIKVIHPKNDDRTYIIKFNIIMPDNFNYNLNLGNGNIDVNSSTKNLVMNIGNGDAKADVNLADNCDVLMSIGNGRISLKIPGSTNAVIDAKVGNGVVKASDLNIEDQQSSIRNLTGKIGNGKGNIDLSVGNGMITVDKK